MALKRFCDVCDLEVVDENDYVTLKITEEHNWGAYEKPRCEISGHTKCMEKKLDLMKELFVQKDVSIKGVTDHENKANSQDSELHERNSS